MSSASRAPLVFISAVLLFLGTLFIYLGGSTVLEQRRYRQQGVRIDAIATGKALRRATTTTDTAYEINYQFKPLEGGPYQQTESVAVPLWERVEKGSSLTVEYVSGAPASARVEPTARMTTPRHSVRLASAASWCFSCSLAGSWC